MTWMERRAESVPAKLPAAVVTVFVLAAGPLDHSIVGPAELFGALHAGAPFGHLAWLGSFGWHSRTASRIVPPAAASSLLVIGRVDATRAMAANAKGGTMRRRNLTNPAHGSIHIPQSLRHGDARRVAREQVIGAARPPHPRPAEGAEGRRHLRMGAHGWVRRDAGPEAADAHGHVRVLAVHALAVQALVKPRASRGRRADRRRGRKGARRPRPLRCTLARDADPGEDLERSHTADPAIPGPRAGSPLAPPAVGSATCRTGPGEPIR